MKIILFVNLIVYSAFAAPFKLTSKTVGTTEITFVHNAEQEETHYTQKVSFVELEKLAPLYPEALGDLKPNDLRHLSMEEFNQIYARLSSGPMPLGDYSGYVLQKPPIYSALRKRVLKQAFSLGQFATLGKQICGKEVEDCLFEFIWKGKRFWPRDDLGRIMAKTIFNPIASGFKIPLIPDFLRTKKLEEAIDFTEGLIDRNSLTIFPMQTFCGISQVDTRRESIVVEATFGDEFGLPHYLSLRDEVVTRKGLDITEEYRMLRSGLYIGKVYTNKIFLFNVVLEKTGIEKPTEMKDACLDTLKAL